MNCLDETTIPMYIIFYLSLYYLVINLVHLPNMSINKQSFAHSHKKETFNDQSQLKETSTILLNQIKRCLVLHLIYN